MHELTETVDDRFFLNPDPIPLSDLRVQPHDLNRKIGIVWRYPKDDGLAIAALDLSRESAQELADTLTTALAESEVWRAL